MAVFWVARGDMTTLGDGEWKGWGKRVPKKHYFFDDSTWGQSCLELALATALVWSLKMPSHCGFMNPSYANLPWSAVLFQGINYWSGLRSVKGRIVKPTWVFQSEWPDALSGFQKFKASLTQPSQAGSHLAAKTAAHFLSEEGGMGDLVSNTSHLYTTASFPGFFPDQDCREATRIESDSQRPAEAIFRCSLSGRRAY